MLNSFSKTCFCQKNCLMSFKNVEGFIGPVVLASSWLLLDGLEEFGRSGHIGLRGKGKGLF